MSTCPGGQPWLKNGVLPNSPQYGLDVVGGSRVKPFGHPLSITPSHACERPSHAAGLGTQPASAVEASDASTGAVPSAAASGEASLAASVEASLAASME